MKNLKYALLIIFPVLLVGCKTTSTLYDWGGYDEGLYEYYHDPVGAKEFPEVLENHLLELEESGRKPAPGLYAEAGTFNLKAGNTPKAINFYKKEAKTWPESKSLMDSLIENLEKKSKNSEVKS